MIKEKTGARIPQDRRSLLLLIALIDLTFADNAASAGDAVSYMPCLSFIDAAGRRRRPTPRNWRDAL